MTPMLLSLLALALVQPQAGTLTTEERALTAFVDADNDHALALLEKVVNINSGTMNFAGVRAAGALLRPEFDALGFKTEWVDGAAFQRAGHLVADHPGAGPRILLIGHLDTVFEPDSPFQKFERIDANRAMGPGITDMKGGDVVMIQALKALNSTGALKSMNIIVVMTGDEEEGGRPLSLSRAALVKAAQGALVAIGFEDGDGNPKTAVIGRRGTTGWELRVKGKPAHSSQIFNTENGYGAIFETARILNAFREKLAGQPHLTFNPGVVLGGTAVDYDGKATRGTGFGKSNVIAEHTVVTGDLRALSPEQVEAAKKAMQDIVAASLPQTSATITFDDGYPPLAPTPGNERLLALYSQASLDVGTGPVVAVDPDKAGAADVSFVAEQAGMILDGVGLMGSGGHTVNETADLSTLPSMAKRMAVLLSGFGAEGLLNLVLLEAGELGVDLRVRLTGPRAAHLVNVLEVGPGQTVRIGVLDGPRGVATVESIDSTAVELRCALEAAAPRRPRVDLLLAVPRPKVMRRLWAQLAALGVSRIILTNAERVERPYFDTHVLTPACYRPLLIEGLQQAKDTLLPMVTIHRQFKVLVEDDLDGISDAGLRLVADPAATTPVGEAIRGGLGSDPGGRLLLAIGPEGGWNAFELGLLDAHGFRAIGMGPRTLRTDTACLALLALANDGLT